MSLTNDQLVEELSKKTVLEIAELVKMLEDKWGVSAAAPVAVAAVGGAARLACCDVLHRFVFCHHQCHPQTWMANIITAVELLGPESRLYTRLW